MPSVALSAEPETVSTPAPGPSPARRVLDVLVLVLLGALLVSWGYARARGQLPGAAALFWAGQALLLVPVAVRVLSASSGTTERVLLLAGAAAAQSLVAYCYSPDQFRFPDELQHLRTAQDVLRTEQLFTPNSYLPVSPGFPGLEEVATALAQVSGLSLFVSGVVTVSVAHAVVPVAAFLLLRELGADARLAAVGVLVYSTGPHYGFYTSLFVYGSLAVPFFLLTLRAVVRAVRGEATVLLVAPPFLAVLVTHHLSALATLAVSALLLVVLRGSGADRRRLGQAAGGLLAALAAAAGWTALYAPSTFGYLGTPLSALLGAGGGEEAVGLPRTAPLWETLASVGAAGLTVLLVVLGLLALRRQQAPRLLRAACLLGLVYPLVLVVRVVVPGGAELAGRGLTYALLLAALPVAVGLLALQRGLPSRPLLLPAAAAVVLLLGSVTAGLPAAFERLPGAHHVAGFQSGLDRQVTALAPWAATLPPDGRVACDVSTCSVLASYGRQQPSTASGTFYARDRQERHRLMAQDGLDLLVADRRTTVATPRTGSYFTDDPREGRHDAPLDPALLDALDGDPLLDRVLDSGAIQVYDTSRTWRD